MVKITKRVVEAAEAQEKDDLIWDDELLPGFRESRTVVRRLLKRSADWLPERRAKLVVV